MKDPRGKDVLMKLAAAADIVVENFRPGVVKKLGIDYEAICRIKPDVIYASMSGFGQTGPYGKKGGFDIIAQGMSGIMMMTGYPGGRPAKVGIAMNDIASGVTALYGILGAYIGSFERARASTWRRRSSKRASRGRLGVRRVLRVGRDPDRDRHAATDARRRTRPTARRTAT